MPQYDYNVSGPRDVYNHMVSLNADMIDAARNDRSKDFLQAREAYNYTAEQNPDVMRYLDNVSKSMADTEPARAVAAKKALPTFVDDTLRNMNLSSDFVNDPGSSMHWDLQGFSDTPTKQRLAKIHRAQRSGEQLGEDDIAFKKAADWAVASHKAALSRGDVAYGGAAGRLREVTDTANNLRASLPMGDKLGSSDVYNTAVAVQKMVGDTGVDMDSARELVGTVVRKIVGTQASESGAPVGVVSRDAMEQAAGYARKLADTAGNLGRTGTRLPDGTMQQTKDPERASEFMRFANEALQGSGELFKDPKSFDSWVSKAGGWYRRAAPTIDALVSSAAGALKVTDPGDMDALRKTMLKISAASPASGVLSIKDVEPEIGNLAVRFDMDARELQSLLSGNLKEIEKPTDAGQLQQVFARELGSRYEDLDTPSRGIVDAMASKRTNVLTKAGMDPRRHKPSEVLAGLKVINDTVMKVPEVKGEGLTANQAFELGTSLKDNVLRRVTDPNIREAYAEQLDELIKQGKEGLAIAPRKFDSVDAALGALASGLPKQQQEAALSAMRSALPVNPSSRFVFKRDYAGEQVKIAGLDTPRLALGVFDPRSTIPDTEVDNLIGKELRVTVGSSTVPLTEIMPINDIKSVMRSSRTLGGSYYALEQEALGRLAKGGALSWDNGRFAVNATKLERMRLQEEKGKPIKSPTVQLPDGSGSVDIGTRSGLVKFLSAVTGDRKMVDAAINDYADYAGTEVQFNDLLVGKGRDPETAPLLASLNAKDAGEAREKLGIIGMLTAGSFGVSPSIAKANNRLKELELKTSSTAAEKEKDRQLVREEGEKNRSAKAVNYRAGLADRRLLTRYEEVSAQLRELRKASSPIPQELIAEYQDLSDGLRASNSGAAE